MKFTADKNQGALFTQNMTVYRLNARATREEWEATTYESLNEQAPLIAEALAGAVDVSTAEWQQSSEPQVPGELVGRVLLTLHNNYDPARELPDHGASMLWRLCSAGLPS